MMRAQQDVHAAVTGIATGGATLVCAHRAAPEGRYFIIPNKGTLRWLIPTEPRFGLPVLQNWSPQNRASRMKWKMLLSAYKLGHLHQVPGITTVGIEAKFLGPDHTDCSPVVYFGTPTPMRKAIATLVNRNSKAAIAVAKAPLGSKAREAIKHEAQALQHLNALNTGVAPQLFAYRENAGVSVQEYVHGHSAPLPFRPAYLRWLMNLQIAGKTVSYSEHFANVQEKLAKLNGCASDYSEVLAALTPKTDRSYPAFIIHGDFAPWNLRITNDNEIVAAIDWEQFCESGLPMADYFNYFFVQSYIYKKPVGLQQLARASEPYLKNVGLQSIDVAPLAIAYLLASMVYFCEEGDFDHASWLASQASAIAGSKL